MRSSATPRRENRASSSARRAIAAVAGLIVAALVLPVGSTPLGAQSDELDTIREQRKQAQAQEAARAAQVDAATVEVGELTAALEALQANVVAQEARLSDAERRLVDAEQRLSDSEAAVADKEREIVDLEDQLASRAITSFLNQGDLGSMLVESSDPTEAVRMQALVEEVTAGEVDVAERLRAAEEDLEVERAVARAAAHEAERLRAQTAAQLVELESARDEQARLTAAAEDRLDHLLSELAAIQALDDELAAQESAALTRLAQELAKKRPQVTLTQPSSAIPIPPPSEIIKVRGFWVHVSIADRVGLMIDAAAADGISLGGGGWRDSANQIRLRREHCGDSDYAIYEMPPSQCSPPTARPGASMHERGLALDFTYNGRLIGTRNNDGYRWLAANAATYGFFNLPSEPWHWSTNGR